MASGAVVEKDHFCFTYQTFFVEKPGSLNVARLPIDRLVLHKQFPSNKSL